MDPCLSFLSFALVHLKKFWLLLTVIAEGDNTGLRLTYYRLEVLQRVHGSPSEGLMFNPNLHKSHVYPLSQNQNNHQAPAFTTYLLRQTRASS